jgi:Holliday junction resolvase-like predicted endonuclease
VAIEYLQRKFALQLLRLRWRTPFGEVDLILRKTENPSYLVVAEIKTLTDMRHLSTRVKPQQIQRLQNVTSWLTETHTRVELWFVFVLPGDEVLILKSDEMSI